MPDGVFVDEGPARPLFFLDLMSPTPEEVAALKRRFGPHRARERVFSPTEPLHRLAALLPKPYLNLTRYAGAFAP